MERWEYEIVEFKSATGQYSPDKIGQYFSAISCEANLKKQQYGWFILGVSETDNKHIVGTAFKRGDPMLLEKFKYEISQDTTDGITFMDIIELQPIVNGEEKRVLMFQIPAAAVGIPTGWRNLYYARSGQSLVSLPQYKIDQIRNEARRDWSKLTLPGATIHHLDKSAISLARQEFIGTPTELVGLIDPDRMEQFSIRTISQEVTNSLAALRENGIAASIRRSNGRRLITLRRAESADNPDIGNNDPIGTTHRKSSALAH